MQYKTILFDLDGTLTDSAPGILNSVRYGCRRIGIPVPDEATLRRFLGPPLIDSFHNLCGLNDADTDRAVAAFREYFPDKGLFENEVYPGIPALLADLDMVVKEFGTVDLGDLDIAAFLTSLTSLAQRHGIEVPGTVTTVGRALVTLEGLLDEFIPDVNMIQIISDHIAGSMSLDRAAKDEIKALGVEGHQALHGLLSAASESRVAMRMLTRGQLRMNMEVVGSEEPMRLLSDMVNRLTMALIVVGLFVGSSIVYYAGMKPIIFGIPVVGFMGYVIAFILSVWIVFDIYFKGRRSKRR